MTNENSQDCKKKRHHRPHLADMPIINWEALQKLSMPPMPPHPPKAPGAEGKDKPHFGPGQGIGGWDGEAPFYNRMVQMEKRYTDMQVDLIPISETDTVLDACCGPGGLVVPIAKKAAKVTGFDASPVMLDLLSKYAAEEGVSDKIETILGDWMDEDTVDGLPEYDIVVSRRSAGLFNIPALVKHARKTVVINVWANDSPSIPATIGKLFEGTQEEGAHPPFPFFKQDRRLGNNVFYNRVYDMGFEPNVRVLDDGWERTFATREEAYTELLKLGKHGIAEGKEDIFRANCDNFLTDRDGEVYFFMPTKSFVMWWDVREWKEKMAERHRRKANHD